MNSRTTWQKAARDTAFSEAVEVAREAARVFLKMGGDGRTEMQRTFQCSGAAANAVADKIEEHAKRTSP